MKHYIAIFVENHIGEWRVVFPDLPGCEARGFSLDDARFAAASALAQRLHGSGPFPEPMDMAAIRQSEDWLSRNSIDLSRAVISTVPLAA